MKAFLVAIVGILLLWLGGVFVVQPFIISSDSMRPALKSGDRILVNRTAYWSARIARGDLIVFDGQDSFSAESGSFVKRVIGIGGDRVACCTDAGHLSINGAAITESSYLYSGDLPSEVPFDALVPEGKLWVMGDHRSESADSRSHLGDPGGGFVLESKVVGQARLVIWPPTRWQPLDSYSFKELN
ncbi:MAG: signal peptidase I [Candidatus Nanopelagicales bacterium]|nr:signal peptidase I [Candidatus Nanopelagicales bacterium]